MSFMWLWLLVMLIMPLSNLIRSFSWSQQLYISFGIYGLLLIVGFKIFCVEETIVNASSLMYCSLLCKSNISIPGEERFLIISLDFINLYSILTPTLWSRFNLSRSVT